MENWNAGYNWTKEQFLTAVGASSQQGEDSLSLYTKHCDQRNLANIKAWAKEAGYYYAEERAGEDTLVVSKKPIDKAMLEEFICTGRSTSSGDVGKLMRLLKLLKKTVPQAEKYWICTTDGKVVCQVGNGNLLLSEEEQKGIQEALADFRKVDDRFREMAIDRQMAYGNSSRDVQGQAYYAFPLWKTAETFEHVLVCWGDRDEISNALAAYQLVSNLYMLQK